MKQWLRTYTTGNIVKTSQDDCECDVFYEVYEQEVIRGRKWAKWANATYSTTGDTQTTHATRSRSRSVWTFLVKVINEQVVQNVLCCNPWSFLWTITLPVHEIEHLIALYSAEFVADLFNSALYTRMSRTEWCMDPINYYPIHGLWDDNFNWWTFWWSLLCTLCHNVIHYFPPYESHIAGGR